MQTLLILFIVIGLTLYGLQEYFQIKLGIRPRPTPSSVIDELARILQGLGDTGTFIDLGSGYGTLIFGLAKRLPGWEFIGVEQSPTPWLMSNLRSIGKNLGNYRFFIGDATMIPLRNYDVVYTNQNATILKKWESNLARRLEPGTLLFTLDSGLPRVKTLEKLTIDDVHTLYIYQKTLPQAAQAAPATPEAAAEVPAPEAAAAPLPENP